MCNTVFYMLLGVTISLAGVSSFKEMPAGPTVGHLSALRSQLLQNYQKLYRPLKDPNNEITVHIGMSLSQIDLHDKKQRMSIVSSLLISWKDEYLVWNPDSYSGLEQLHFDSTDIWTPDISLLNSATKISIIPTDNLRLMVSSNGDVVWTPPIAAEVPCRINLYNWPSDTQRCTFKFASWTHQGDQLDLQLRNQSISLERYVESNRWKLKTSHAVRKNTKYNGEVFVEADFSFSVMRLGSSRVRYVSHTTVAVLIAVLLAYVLPMSFHLSRLIIHIFGLSILILCDMMLYLTLPPGGGPTPQIVAYYSGTIVLTSMSLVANVLLTTASFMSGPQKLLRRRLASLLPISKSVNGLISEEVGYTHLQEEMTSFSETNEPGNSGDQQPPPPERPAVTTRTSPSPGSPNDVPAITIQRVVNGVLFCLFAVAYLIDYSVLVSTVIE